MYMNPDDWQRITFFANQAPEIISLHFVKNYFLIFPSSIQAASCSLLHRLSEAILSPKHMTFSEPSSRIQ